MNYLNFKYLAICKVLQNYRKIDSISISVIFSLFKEFLDKSKPQNYTMNLSNK